MISSPHVLLCQNDTTIPHWHHFDSRPQLQYPPPWDVARCSFLPKRCVPAAGPWSPVGRVEGWKSKRFKPWKIKSSLLLMLHTSGFITSLSMFIPQSPRSLFHNSQVKRWREQDEFLPETRNVSFPEEQGYHLSFRYHQFGRLAPTGWSKWLPFLIEILETRCGFFKSHRKNQQLFIGQNHNPQQSTNNHHPAPPPPPQNPSPCSTISN